MKVVFEVEVDGRGGLGGVAWAVHELIDGRWEGSDN